MYTLPTIEARKNKNSGSGQKSTTGGTTLNAIEERKKKLSQGKSDITEKPIEATKQLSPTDTKVGDSSIDINIDEPRIFTRPPQDAGMVYIGQGTTSMGQGVNIIEGVAPKKTKFTINEEKRVQQADLIMGAEQLGKPYIDTLKEDEKQILIEGLKNQRASKDVDYLKRQKAQEIISQNFPEKMTAADPKSKIISAETLDPRDPKNWAFYEKNRKNFDTEYEGKIIPAEKKTLLDDPLENIDAALNIGKYGVFSTMGAMQQWAGGMIGSEGMQQSGEKFRKESDTRGEWESVRFNQEMDTNDSNIFDSRFWTQKVPQSVPFMVTLAPAGIAGAAAGSATAGAFGLGSIGTYLTTAGFAGVSSRFAEGMAEGADTYATLKDRGVSDSKASERAWKTTAANMTLMFSDITQLAITFAPTSRIMPGGNQTLKNTIVGAGKFSFDAASEGGEEVFQGYVQQYNVAVGEGKEPVSMFDYMNTDEARQVFILGATTGLALGSLGVAKDSYDNFSRRAEAQVETVEQAVEKNDIDFMGKMEVLAQKDAITKDTLDAVKTLLNIKIQENTGMTYEQWYTQGLQARSEKIQKTAEKVQKMEETTRKARENTKVETLKFETVPDLQKNFEQQTGETVQEAIKKVEAVENSDVPMQMPYTKEQIGTIRTIQKVQEKAGKFLYTPIKATELEDIKANGIVPSEKKIVLGENADIAKVVDKEADVMIRVNDKQKFADFEVAQVESGENLFQTTTTIPPKNIEINMGNGWESLAKIQTQMLEDLRKEQEEEYQQTGQYNTISEDTSITYNDLEEVAQKIAKVLNDPKLVFGLKRAKGAEMSTKTERYLKNSKEGTIEALTEEFTSLKNGLKEIVEYYSRTKKHPYTRQKLQELYETLANGEYDFLEQSDIFQSTINPYLYEGKKSVPTKVRKPKGERAGGDSTSSNPDMKPDSVEVKKDETKTEKGATDKIKTKQEKLGGRTPEEAVKEIRWGYGFDKKELREVGIPTEATGYESTAVVGKLDGVPVVGVNYDGTYQGFAIAKEYQGIGLGEAILREDLDRDGVVLVTSPGTAMMSLMKKIGEVEEVKDGGDIWSVKKIEKQKTEDEKIGTNKTGIVNALKEVDKEFSKEESKYPVFANIDEKTAMEASRGTSFDPEKRGQQRIEGFKKEMIDLYDELLPEAKTDEQKEILNSEIVAVSEKLAQKNNEINRAESGVVSSMITGPARFPVERMKKKNEAIQKKYQEYIEFKERAKNAIIKKLKGQEIEEVGGPIEALKVEIQKLTESRDKAKIINAAIKKYKTQEAIYSALIDSGISEKLAQEASTPTRSSGKIETIYLTNLNNKIKEREKKLEKMEKIESIKGTDDEMKELYSFDGGKVIDNRGADRVQIIFDERPNSDKMYELKKRGWKWSPKNEAWQRFRNSGSVKVAREMFPEVETKKFQSIELTTKILDKLGDRETVSKEFIMNLTNSGDIKQIEKEMIREILKTEGDKVNVQEFKDKVKMELIPLKVATREDRLKIDPNAEDYFADPNKYEYVNLPKELRGNVKDYRENIYESPIEVFAGNIHFNGQTKNYFGHTRVEDMAGTDPYKPDYTKANGVRRVIEVQSDLYQKNRILEETKQAREILSNPNYFPENEKNFTTPGVRQAIVDEAQGRVDKISILEQYNDPTAHFRMIREEISKASKDRMKVLQFPTGETAMKIEGLGVNNDWFFGYGEQLKVGSEEVGKKISRTRDMDRYGDTDAWVIVETLGEGKFKAIPRDDIADSEYRDLQEGIITNDIVNARSVETFDISGKIDTSNPIYKFYEKEVGKYLKNNYNGKLVTDEKGVSWYEIDITPDMQKKVLAFQEKNADAWIYDIVGAKYGVKPFAQEKVDLKDTYNEAMKLAPEGWNIRIEYPTPENYLENVVAYADLETKEIVISSTEARKSTAAHEVVHAALSELDEKRRNDILSISKAQWEKQTSTSLSMNDAEEFLAEEFKYYIENQKYKTKTIAGRLREFISKLWNTIKGVFGKDNKIKTFYDDVLAGKIKSTETNTGKKFQSAYDEKTQKMYDSIDDEQWGTNFSRMAKYKTTDELRGKKRIDPKKGQNRRSLGRWASDLLIPIDEILGKISPKIKNRVIKFEFDIMNDPRKKDMLKILEATMKKLSGKKSQEAYRIIDMAMKNSDMPIVEDMAKELGIHEEILQIRATLEKMHESAREVGLDIGYIENYFPRVVADYQKMLEYIYGSEAGEGILQAIKLIEEKKGHELTLEEKINLANKLLKGFDVDGIVLNIPGNVKSRIIEEVTFENDYLYLDSFEALAIYTNTITEAVAARKLFGKGESLHDSIGAWTIKLVSEGTIKPVDEIEISRILKSRFEDNSMSTFVNSYRALAYLTTMGSPISAISQIQDLAFSFFENGILKSIPAVGKAAIRKSLVSREDIGITDIGHELSDNGKLQRWVTKTFQLVGISYLDKVGKETMINGAYTRMRKEAIAGTLKELDVFEDQKVADQVVEDFKNNVVSEDIKYLLFAKLCEYQPLTRSQMPVYYNTMKNGRIIYMLKTYLVKQLSVFREKGVKDIVQGIKTGNMKQMTKGAVNFIHLGILLMLMGMTADALKNLLLNRPFALEDMVIDNMLKLAGFSKYTVYQVREKTLSEGILSIVTPPFNFFNDIIQDMYDEKVGEDITKAQSINNIPLGGKLYYWWFGKGKDKSDKKRGKAETKKKANSNPFSNSAAFKSTSGFSNSSAWK